MANSKTSSLYHSEKKSEKKLGPMRPMKPQIHNKDLWLQF